MNAPGRRGTCPRLAAPMETGDGLLARLIPSGSTMALDALAKLCVAVRACGNGIIEITSRGSIQVRGLTVESAPGFASEIMPLGIDGGDLIPVLINPLSGLDPEEVIKVATIARSLRRRLGAAHFASDLSAKVTVVLDGGGLLHLDDTAADIRLSAVVGPEGPVFCLALGGTASSAVPVGAVAPNDVAECVMRLLELLSRRAPHARMRRVLSDEGPSAFAEVVEDLMQSMPQPLTRKPAQPIRIFDFGADGFALGIGMPFGHCDADMLGALIDAAQQAGARGWRTAPGRALLFSGLSRAAAPELKSRAGSLGFIVDADDPRRNVVACAGSPICASGQIPARALAPIVARALARQLGGGKIVHVSGCSKGCAHSAPTAVAVFGSNGVCDIRLNGRSAYTVTVEELPLQIVAMSQEPQS